MDATSDSVFDSWLDRDPVAFHARFRPNACAAIELATRARHSYAQVDARIARATGWLKAQGVGQGDRVGYLGRNGLNQLSIMFGARRLGAIFCPLNWRLAGPEVAVIVDDAQAKLLIADAEFADAAKAGAQGLATTLYELDAGGANLAAAIDAAAPAEAISVPPSAPFIILYTSGTTGRPKGAVITRANAWFSAVNFSSIGHVNKTSVMLCDAPMFHTVGLIAVTQTCLQSGGTVVFSERFLPETTLAALNDEALGVTHYFGVPQITQMLREHPAYTPRAFARLTGLFSGGAPLPPSQLEAFLADGVNLANGYGMTEVGTVLCMPLDTDLIRARPHSAGLPAAAVQIRIVKQDGTDAAVGESGEMWLKGPAVMPGYWNRPDENAKAFTGGWFRTGDAASVDAGGYYTLLDRWKDMYITGGENVYPAEVEAVLLRLSGVAEAAVIGVPDPKWGECGIAYVVAEAGADLTGPDLAAACGPHLARYKLPKDVRLVDALPRTASGKVKKDVLRQMAAEG